MWERAWEGQEGLEFPGNMTFKLCSRLGKSGAEEDGQIL